MKLPFQAWPLLALVVLAGPAGAGSQLFKCIDGARTIYQQQACSVSTAADPAASAARADAAPPAAPRKLKPASASASAAPATPR